MKKLVLFGLALACALGLYGCNQNVAETEKTDVGKPASETVTEQETGISTISLIRGVGYTEEYDAQMNDVVIKATYPAVYTYYEDENKYPGLSKTFGDRYKAIKDKQTEFISENKGDVVELNLDMGEAFIPMEAAENVAVRRADTLVTSLLYYGEMYFGGAHGTPFMWGESYDTQSGKRLELSDAVADMGKLYAAIEEQLGIFWADLVRENAMSVEEVLADKDYASWTVDYNGITFWFNPYTIANYPTGIQSVTVSNSEYPDVLKDEYKKSPDAYGVELARESSFYCDVNDDGKTDEIIFSAYMNDDEGNPGNISIYINGESYDEECFMYDAEAVFVKTKDGGKYILVETLSDNDYRETRCYDVSDGVKSTGVISGGLRRIYHEGDGIVTHQVLTNPDSFYMQQTTQLLSTVTGYKKCYIDTEGRPESQSIMFMFDEENCFELTLKAEIEAEVYDTEAQKSEGKKTLRTGEKVLYCGTDNEGSALLKCADGSVCKVSIAYGENAREINGIAIDDVFEGMLYAG